MYNAIFPARRIAAIQVAFALLTATTFPAHASPEIERVSGPAIEGEALTVYGAGFTDKANGPPLLWWTADNGMEPTNLGRKTSWDGFVSTQSGEIQSVVVAPGSSQSYRFNHGVSSNAALGRVLFDTGVFYMWRKKYDDFRATAQAVNSVQGLTFNFKTLRVYGPDWGSTSGNNNLYISLQGGENDNYNFINEWGGNKTVPTTTWGIAAQEPHAYQWTNEQLLYRTNSGLGTNDSIFRWTINNKQTYTGLTNDRDADRPSPLEQIFQTQISNGAKNPSWVYYDALYIDDSWHRVLLSDAADWAEARNIEVQIPVTWSENSIQIIFRLGSLDAGNPLYLYVFDSGNRVNTRGFLVSCADCPALPDAPRDVAVE